MKAAKAVKECVYHVRRSGDWVLRLGDGTVESQRRCQAALDDLWAYTGEMFNGDAIDDEMADSGIGIAPAALADEWRATVTAQLAAATLSVPRDDWSASGGRAGLHTEHMVHLLAELQFVQRAYPGLKW